MSVIRSFSGAFFPPYLDWIRRDAEYGHLSRSKSSAEQKPQSKVISITRLQTNELLVASQWTVSRESKSCNLRVYHIASQLIMSLSHFELHANKPVSCKSVSLWVANHQVSNF